MLTRIEMTRKYPRTSALVDLRGRTTNIQVYYKSLGVYLIPANVIECALIGVKLHGQKAPTFMGLETFGCG
jgi:hypothetical protein